MAVTIRAAVPADAEQIAHVHVESWRTTYRGLMPDAVLAGLTIEPRARYWGSIITNPEAAEVVHVAEAPGGQIVGFASGGPESDGNPDFTSKLYAIYLLQEWQRGGIGRRLARDVVRDLLARGHESMLLWVLADNPARGFYERLGGVVVAEKLEAIGGVELRELAFGWSDLPRLSAELCAETT